VLQKLAKAAAPVVDEQGIVINSQRMSSQTQLSESTMPEGAAGISPGNNNKRRQQAPGDVDIDIPVLKVERRNPRLKHTNFLASYQCFDVKQRLKLQA